MQPASAKEIAKNAVGIAAAHLIENGMLVGLGTGSTANYFIRALIKRCQEEGLKITAVATSKESERLAKEGGIQLYEVNQISSLDMTVDGADEIDHQKRMIKGGGGALLREKIIASISREMIVIIDEDKLVDQLGIFPLPVEIVPFAHKITLKHIADLGFHGAFRQSAHHELYLTDNSNYIIDITFPAGCQAPEATNQALKAIPGVVETGFFFNLAGRVLIGSGSGEVKTI
jgi:ribose 5-phosphate isomerase A